MEYLEGEPIDKYCASRNLDIDARIDLFLEVCSAVEYAHRNLVLHRDIKGRNIFAGADGKPKLLDFGIAKLLGDTGEGRTETGVRPLTPQSASPEQVKGEPLTTSSDIYALGVLLYQLLAGKPPYDLSKTTPSQTLDLICKVDPPPPSAVAGALGDRLEGDLDNIAAKAMRKEPERRYRSVDELADDLIRYRKGLPVSARPDTWSYRAEKFLRRNWRETAVAALVVIVAGAGVFSTLREARRADRRFRELRGLAHAVVFEIHDSVEKLPGSTGARELIIKRALGYLDGLTAEAGADAGLLKELAQSYERLGAVQGNRYGPHTGDYPGAIRSLNRAGELYGRLASAAPRDADASRGIAQVKGRLSLIALTQGRREDGVNLARESLKSRQELAARTHDEADRRDVALGHRDLCQALLQGGQLGPATAECKAAVDTYDAWLAKHPESKDVKRGLSTALKRYGQLLNRQRRPEGVRMYQRSLEIDEALVAANPADRAAKRALMIDHEDFGRIFFFRQDYARSVASLRRALAIAEPLAASDPGDEGSRAGLRITNELLATSLAYAGEGDESLAAAKRALAIAEQERKVAPSASADKAVATCHQAMGDALWALAKSGKGKLADAIATMEKSRAMLLALGEPDVEMRSTLAYLDRRLAELRGPA